VFPERCTTRKLQKKSPDNDIRSFLPIDELTKFQSHIIQTLQTGLF